MDPGRFGRAAARSAPMGASRQSAAASSRAARRRSPPPASRGAGPGLVGVAILGTPCCSGRWSWQAESSEQVASGGASEGLQRGALRSRRSGSSSALELGGPPCAIVGGHLAPLGGGSAAARTATSDHAAVRTSCRTRACTAAPRLPSSRTLISAPPATFGRSL
jgi:hypothetical protein